MNGTYQGTVFAPGENARQPVTVTLKSHGLEAAWGDERHEVPYHKLSAARGGYNNALLVLSFDTEAGAVQLFFENKEVAREMEQYRLPPGLATQLKQAAPKGGAMKSLLLWGSLVVLVGIGLYFGIVAGFGVAVEVAVDQIPVEMETELGKSAAQQQLTDYQVCSAEVVNRAIGEIGKRLSDEIPDSQYSYTFTVIDTPDVNAFALPGGYIFINWGLIEEADSADQVAGVLAHEIQHVVKRHGLRNVIGRAGIGLLVAFFLGDMQGLGGLIAGGAGELAALSFSREQEEEADRLGIDLLYAAHFDPDGMPQFFEKLKEEQAKKGMDVPSFMSTHPDTNARIATLRTFIESQGKADVKPLAISWDEVKKAGCVPVHKSSIGEEETEAE